MNNNSAIYEEIKNKIINLDLTPGTKIREEDLAAEYGISRTPIRGIIARLVQDGLLNVVPQKGTFVSQISIDDINTYIFMRKCVELKIITLAADIINQDNVAPLLEILEKQAEVCKQEPSIEKSKAFYKYDNEFHQTLFNIVGLNGVWDILVEGAVPLNRARIMANLRVSEKVSAVYLQHKAIIDKLLNGDKEGAYAAYEQHLDTGFDGLGVVIEQYKDYFIGGAE